MALFRPTVRLLAPLTQFRPALTRIPDMFAQLSPWSESAPKCNLVERPDRWEVTAELPGFKKEDVHVEVHQGVLHIRAESSSEKKEEGETEGVKWHKVESTMGSLHRAVKLPPSADLDKITAKSENGMLSVKVAKKAEAKGASPRKVPVE